MIKKLFKFIFIFSIWSAIACAFSILYFAHDLPDIEKLATIEKNRKITIIDNNDEILTNYGDLYGNFVNYDNIPKQLIHAVLATEDRRFFQHSGIDFIGLIRAAFVNFKAGYVVQGGSTITQQLAKIVFLSSEKTFKRKFQEVILSFYIENNLSKEKILTIYLNRVYMGSGIYGIDAAAKYYFGKKLKDISLNEAAIITGLLKAPSRYSPALNAEKSGKRAYQILLNMLDAGYISEEDLKKANDLPVTLENNELGYLKHSYFTSWVVDQVNTLIPDDGDDLIVKTTLDKNLQAIAEKSLEHIMSTKGDKKAEQASLVSMNVDGRIQAMVGGRNFSKSPFNRVTQALRQPGSAFKHAVYLAGFENGLTPDDIMVDEPIIMGKWKPKNNSKKYYGPLSLREAFSWSINTITIKISEMVGRDKVIEVAEKLGITSDIMPYPSLALGAFEVTPLELTGSYATLANNGYKVEPYGIESIKSYDNKLLYNRSQIFEKVVDDKALNYIYDVMIDVVENGTGKAGKLDRQVAAKTGTSQNFRDTWFIGFTKDLVTGVWVGNDDDSATKVMGGFSVPAQIWKDYMNKATVGRSKENILDNYGKEEEKDEEEIDPINDIIENNY